MACKAINKNSRNGKRPYAKHMWESCLVRGHRRDRCARCSTLKVYGVPAEVRFWDYVDIRGAGDCWIWRAYKHPDGYGVFTYAPQRTPTGFVNHTMMAHCYAWMLAGRDLPDFKARMTLDHACNTRACVNVRHLRIMSLADNVRRYSLERTRCKRGHNLRKPKAWYYYGSGARRRCRLCLGQKAQ